MTKKVLGDYDSVIDQTNLNFDLFEYDKLTLVGFKCLVIAMRLHDADQLPYRSIILREMEKPDVDLNQLREACRAYADRAANLRVGTSSATTRSRHFRSIRRPKRNVHLRRTPKVQARVRAVVQQLISIS